MPAKKLTYTKISVKTCSLPTCQNEFIDDTAQQRRTMCSEECRVQNKRNLAKLQQIAQRKGSLGKFTCLLCNGVFTKTGTRQRVCHGCKPKWKNKVNAKYREKCKEPGYEMAHDKTIMNYAFKRSIAKTDCLRYGRCLDDAVDNGAPDIPCEGCELYQAGPRRLFEPLQSNFYASTIDHCKVALFGRQVNKKEFSDGV